MFLTKPVVWGANHATSDFFPVHHLWTIPAFNIKLPELLTASKNDSQNGGLQESQLRGTVPIVSHQAAIKSEKP